MGVIYGIIEIDVQCPSCNGTGVYIGMAERSGAAVICNNCNGTGKYHYKYSYEEFAGIKKREDIKRVYKSGYGFEIALGELYFKNIGSVDMNKEGVSYDEFLDGKMPDHIKMLACPMLADQRECHKIRRFVDGCNELNGSSLLGRSIYDCKNQSKKLDCWERFNKE